MFSWINESTNSICFMICSSYCPIVFSFWRASPALRGGYTMLIPKVASNDGISYWDAANISDTDGQHDVAKHKDPQRLRGKDGKGPVRSLRSSICHIFPRGLLSTVAAMCKVSIEIGWNRKIIHQDLGKSPERLWKWRRWNGGATNGLGATYGYGGVPTAGARRGLNHIGAGQTPRRNAVEEWNAQCPVFAAPHFPGGIGMNSNEAHISHINLQRQVKDLRHLVSQCPCQQGWPHVLCCSVYSAWCVDIVKCSVCYAAWILVKIPTGPFPLEHQPSWRGHENHESLDLFGATLSSLVMVLRFEDVWSW